MESSTVFFAWALEDHRAQSMERPSVRRLEHRISLLLLLLLVDEEEEDALRLFLFDSSVGCALKRLSSSFSSSTPSSPLLLSLWLSLLSALLRVHRKLSCRPRVPTKEEKKTRKKAAEGEGEDMQEEERERERRVEETCLLLVDETEEKRKKKRGK